MILDEIAEKTRARVEEDKKQIPFFHMRNEAERLAAESPKGNRPKLFPFYQTLKSPGISFICEVKKASPSKGVIAEEFPYLEIAQEYEIAGASAISCLTEPYYFQGKDLYLKEITQHVTIPVLRKDFTIDPYMIYQGLDAWRIGNPADLFAAFAVGVRRVSGDRNGAWYVGVSRGTRWSGKWRWHLVVSNVTLEYIPCLPSPS